MKQLTVVCVVGMLVVFSAVSFAQAPFSVPLTLTDPLDSTITMYFGADPAAHFCMDSTDIFFGQGEMQDGGPPPPTQSGGPFWTYFLTPRESQPLVCFGQGGVVDFRPLWSETQVDTFHVAFWNTSVVHVTWPSGLGLYAKRLQLVDVFGFPPGHPSRIDVDMLTQADAYVSSPHSEFYIIFEPLAPEFVPSITEINFSGIVPGSSGEQSFDVGNDGETDLEMEVYIDETLLKLKTGELAIDPDGHVSVPPGDSVEFTVTFTPSSPGTYDADIVFELWGGNTVIRIPISAEAATECPPWTMKYNYPTVNGKEDMGFKIGTAAKKLHRGLALDVAGNAYVCGYGEGGDIVATKLVKTKYDIKVVKYDVDGNVVWVGRYNPFILGKYHDEKGHAICVDASGNAYVAGYRDSDAPTKTDAVVVKFNAADGTVAWDAVYDGGMGGKKEYAYGIAVDPAGEYVYACGEADKVASKIDGFVMCVNAATGDIEWTDLYNSPSISNAKDYFYDIACTPDGDAVATGMSEGQYWNPTTSKWIKTKYDIPVIKYNGGGGGGRAWEVRYNNSELVKGVPKNGSDYGYQIKVDNHGNIYVGGCTEYIFKFDMVGLKYDPAGNLLAKGRYNNYPAGAITKGGADIGYAIDYDAEGNMYVAGVSANGYWDAVQAKFISKKNDMAVVKFAATGDTAAVLWSRLYDSNVLPKYTDDIAVDLDVCDAGNVVFVAGWGDRGVGFKKDILTLQVDMTTGALGPVGSKNGSKLKDDFGYNVAARPISCCAVVIGVVEEKLPSPAIETKLDFITMQGPAGTPLGGPVTAPGAYEGDDIEMIPAVITLYDNYPNPFNPSTTIRIELSDPSVVTMKIFNILGQEVQTLLDNEEVDAGEQEVTFDARNLASGVYFYRVAAQTITEEGTLGQSFMTVKKMMLLK